MTVRAFEGISQLYDSDGGLAASFDVDAYRLEIRPEDVALDAVLTEERNHFLYLSHLLRTFDPPPIEESSVPEVGSGGEALTHAGRLQARSWPLARRIGNSVGAHGSPR